MNFHVQFVVTTMGCKFFPVFVNAAAFAAPRHAQPSFFATAGNTLDGDHACIRLLKVVSHCGKQVTVRHETVMLGIDNHAVFVTADMTFPVKPVEESEYDLTQVISCDGECLNTHVDIVVNVMIFKNNQPSHGLCR
jgi:hypothetical protein